MIPNDEEYQELFEELENYEKYGVPMMIEGTRVSPMQVISAYMVKEAGTYMRDYIIDDDGNIEELTFQKIKEDH
ncbi:MAG: hypothetical protein PHN80_09240 [Hespellia sp.]|nr:hypothetical protein [Hespellia sp.]